MTCGILPLGACSNAPWAANLERSLAADPRLQESPAIAEASPNDSPNGSLESGTAQLPAGFPGEIPRYPNADLVAVTQPITSEVAQPTQTRWATADSSDQVRQFYQDSLKTNGWQLDQPGVSGAIVASRDNLRVTVGTASSSASSEATASNAVGKTEFTLSYQFSEGVGQSSNPSSQTSLPQPGDPAFVGPVPPSGLSSEAQTPDAQTNVAQSPDRSAATSSYADLNQTPPELQKYITDLLKLGALPLRSSASSNTTSNSPTFKPNQAITRREYARWLVAANNQIYANQSGRQVRLGTSTDRPAFPDVPVSDPDFGAIQGLANAGLITSALSGDGSPVSFRPDAPLTREDMVLWKVPVDIRRSLPNANLDTLQQTWGFQDAAKIDPKAQRAVIADYQNGDLANIRRAFGYTTLFQPKKTVTRAEAAAALWYFGSQGEGLSAKDALSVPEASPRPPEKPIGG